MKRTIAVTAATTIFTAGLLFVGYKGYQDHVILAQVVAYLNQQAIARGEVPQPNVQVNPEAKK